MITYNGNEMMLQNDMGNTLIQDSKTGHIMGLSEGFVPVGLKEHGGIMYIASVNKEGKGEIGTIPSPILTLSQNYPNDTESRTATLVNANGPDHNLTILSDYKIAPGEKFLIGLNLYLDEDQQKTWYGKPMITCFNGENIVRGMYNIKLYTVYDTNSVCLDKLISTPQKYCISNGDLNTSNYWFISSNIIKDVDINKTYIAKEFKTYPGNIPAGRLAIKVELENIDSFSLIKSKQTEGINKNELTLAPKVSKKTDGYKLDFPGFEYRTSSARFIGKVEFCLYDQKTKEILYDSKNMAGWEQGLELTEDRTVILLENYTNPNLNVYGICADQFAKTPLFSYNIGSNLNNWYQIVVTYYDQFDGKIDTYKYSFNPYHILNFEENYSLEWRQGLEYQQLYNTSTDGQVSIFTEDGVNLQDSISIKAVLSKGSEFIPNSDNPYIKFLHNDGPEGGGPSYRDGFAPVASLNTRELNFQDITSNPLYITLPSVNNLNYLYTDTKFKFTPIDETSKCDITWSLNGDLFLNEYSKSLFSVSVLNRTVEGSLNIYPYNSSELFTADGQPNPNNYYYQVQSTVLAPSIVVDNKYNGQSIPLLTNLNVTDVELYDGNTTYDEKGQYQDSGITDVTISAVLSSNTPNWKWQLILSNISDYTIIPNFSLYGNSDTKLDIPMGLDRNGNPQPAWTFGKSLLTFVDSKPTSDHSSFVKTVEYLPETKSITQIIYPGTYLLNLNAYSTTGSVTITIDNENPVDVQITGRYFTPQLIYVSKDAKLKLSWSNINKLRNIGLYQLSKPVWNTDRTQFGENKVYDIKAYQDDALDVKSEVIIPLQASYYEQASCYDRSYEYYTGPTEAYMTDRHKLANGTILNFVYTWDKYDATKAQVDVIPAHLEEMSILTYRNQKQ